MLEAYYAVVIPFLLLTSICLAAAEEPRCDLDYGSPSYNDCRDLALQLWDGWPGNFGDNREHLFSVRGATIPGWAPAIISRKYLPIFAIQGQSLDLYQQSPHPIAMRADHLWPTKGTCKMSLTAIQLFNGSITIDTAYVRYLLLSFIGYCIPCVGSARLGMRVEFGF